MIISFASSSSIIMLSLIVLIFTVFRTYVVTYLIPTSYLRTIMKYSGKEERIERRFRQEEDY